MTEINAPPSYNEAILQRKLSEQRHTTIVNNAQINDEIQLLQPSADELNTAKDKSQHKETYPSDHPTDQKGNGKVTVGKVLLIGLLMLVSPWCACRMIRKTNDPNGQQNKRPRSRGCCGQSCNGDRMIRQQQRGERRIQRLERRIERKTEKMDRKEARDKLCDRKREKGERKIQKWENKIEQRQGMIGSTCGPSNARCHRGTAAHTRAMKC
ncbi:uncharacterized protein FA14DRAFT_182395 [Meira miltonrushii]|uniref:Uncharacterized protein n=1 Tax=Meira miltonrushii TaxID=1280837 RepID=A0A316V217_9BASI|nr:uncharacterized protein FA14DRAFT_182395 [Meira miltonrushii]PWN31597.1 hypothetical protein FA14DRAFT_182395 [Meira miltonrushii]